MVDNVVVLKFWKKYTSFIQVFNAMFMKSHIIIDSKIKKRLIKLRCMLSTHGSVIKDLIDHVEKCDKFWSEKDEKSL